MGCFPVFAATLQVRDTAACMCENPFANFIVASRGKQRERDPERIDPLGGPPQQFVAGPVLFVVMLPAKWNGPFVGRLLALDLDRACRTDSISGYE
jgi:hypothetical protein